MKLSRIQRKKIERVVLKFLMYDKPERRFG
jgi:hypothetical protein